MKPLMVLIRRKWLAVGTLLMVLIAALIAPLALAAPADQTATVLRIGYLGVRGSQTANGAQLAIDQINAAGGITAPDGTVFQLALITLDAEPTADTLAQALGELQAENVNVILGPDSNALITPDNITALVEAGRPVLTGATGDALTDYDQANLIFRTRAPERVFSYAIASYLTGDLDLDQIVAVQTEVEFTEALMHFESALSNNGITLIEKVQLPGGEALAGETQRLIELNPQAIVMWGTPDDAALLLGVLRGAGWSGVFAFRKADEAARAQALPDNLADGVLGMDSWSYADPLQASRIFLRDYVVAFGEVPGPLAVAAYDAVWYMYFGVTAAGLDSAQLQAALIEGTPRTLVQGVVHPLEFGNGDLVRAAVVYKLGPRGGSTVLARFDDITRLTLEQAGPSFEPTPVPTEAGTPIPPTSSVPTATLEGTWVRVNVDTLNVRIGPGPNYDKIGEAKRDETLRVLGAIADYTWVAVDFQGSVGWVKTEFIEVLGSLTGVNIVQPPATPTLAATPTSTLPANPDLVIDTVVLDQAQPIPGRAFTATVTVRNAGAAAVGRFAVAATWEPGSVYTASFVEGLAGGQSAQAYLTPTVTGTGVFQVGIVVDLNNDVAESNESNNVYNLSYRVDYPLFANQTNIQLNANTMFDLYGGTNDFKWDGYNVDLEPGASVGILTGVTYENVHYGLLDPGVINNTVGLTVGQTTAGTVFGLYTVEGKRAVVRIDNRVDQTIWISFRVYNNTP